MYRNSLRSERRASAPDVVALAGLLARGVDCTVYGEATTIPIVDIAQTLLNTLQKAFEASVAGERSPETLEYAMIWRAIMDDPLRLLAHVGSGADRVIKDLSPLGELIGKRHEPILKPTEEDLLRLEGMRNIIVALYTLFLEKRLTFVENSVQSSDILLSELSSL